MGHPLFDLTGKTAVVVGGTSGIGLAMAVGLAEAGADVVEMEAAGVAAKLAISGGTPVQGIPVGALVDTLKKQGAVLEYVPAAQALAIHRKHRRDLAGDRLEPR